MPKLNYSKMPVLTLGALVARIISTAELHKINDAGVNAKLQELKTVSETYQMGLNKKNYSDLTKQIQEKDKQRDKLIRAFRKFSVSQIDAPLPVVAEAAKRAKWIFNSYMKSVEASSYGEESGKISVFLNVFNSKENADIVQILNLRCWIDALENLQNEFRNLQSERIDCKTELQQIRSASSVRKDLIDGLLNFFDYLKAAIIINNDEDLKLLQKVIEVIKKDTAQNLSKHYRKGKPNDEATPNVNNS